LAVSFIFRFISFHSLMPCKGVVNAQLKVYDTANARVVDASVVPLQLSAPLSSTLYGVAEKEADLIKAAQQWQY
jgi:choline dehydrogenase-like flavoprotein